MSPSYTLRNKRVWVAGHRGLVGSALVRRLAGEGCEIVTAPRETVDLRRPDQVEKWAREMHPQAVFLAAARVGGIHANSTRPAESSTTTSRSRPQWSRHVARRRWRSFC